MGSSVSVSGDTAVVGEFGNDDADGDSGSAYVFLTPRAAIQSLIADVGALAALNPGRGDSLTKSSRQP